MGFRFGCLVFPAAFCWFPAFAAPQLRLSNASVFVSAPVGTTAPAQTVDAYNIGDGSLHPTLSVSPEAAWLTASIGAEQGGHIPLQFSFSTSTLPPGAYTAEVTVSDPNAIDAPQVITVTAQVGGDGPSINEYVPPGKSVDVLLEPYFPPGTPGICYTFGYPCPSFDTTTNDGGAWLSIVDEMPASILFMDSLYIQLSAAANMASGTYTGNVQVFDGSNALYQTIPVTMNVTTRPIAVPSIAQISATLAQGGPPVTYPFPLPPYGLLSNHGVRQGERREKLVYPFPPSIALNPAYSFWPYISLANQGEGSLVVRHVTASGTGVRAYGDDGLALVTLDPGSLNVGTYTDGLVTFQCNAANCPLQIPVNLQIVPQGPPVLNYQGAMAWAGPGTVAPGELMVVEGQQLSNTAPAFASGFPLPDTLGGVTVLVNGAAVPLYYSSSGQIAFVMPMATPTGPALVEVERDGQFNNLLQFSNLISVTVADVAPQIVAITDTSDNVIDVGHPAKPGETLVIWAVGLGQTNPPVPDGMAAPANPLATTTVTPTVDFWEPGLDEVTPTSATLTPGEAGVYKVIVTVPPKAAGNISVYLSESGALESNWVTIAVQ
jgi:uncharacterized protein (TIGR03437 family)